MAKTLEDILRGEQEKPRSAGSLEQLAAEGELGLQESPQDLHTKLQTDPVFQTLTPQQKTTYVMTRLHGPTAVPTTSGPETIPSRVMSGAARGLSETVGGVGGAISGAYEALTGLPAGLKKAFGPQPPATPEEQAEINKPAPTLGELIKPERVSVLGPIGKQYGEAFGRDPAEATGRVGFDALTYLLGLGGKATGAKVAEGTAAAEAEALSRGIPGAPATVMEARKGILPGSAKAIAASPLGESRVAALAAERQPAFTEAINRLTQQGAPETRVVRPETLFGEAPTQVGAGKTVKAGIKAHKGRIRGIESTQWTGLQDEIENRGIRAGLENTIQAAQPLYATSKEAFDLMASQMSPEAQRILQRAVSGEAVPALPPMSMGRPTAELLGRLPEEVRRRTLEGTGYSAAEGASWPAVKEIRTKIGDMIESRLKTNPIGDPETRALSILRDALTTDMKAALEGHPDLLRQFETASETTTYKHQTFGKGMTGGILRKEPKVQPSQIIEKGIAGTPEQARALRRAVGPEAEAAEALKSGSMRELLERHSKKGGTDYAAALEDLTGNPNYKRLMGTEGYNAARDSLLGQSKVQAQSSLTELFQKSTKGKLGEADSVFNGPGFADRWQSARPKFEKMGLTPEHLKAIDDFAKNARELSLSKTTTSGYGKYFTMGTLLGGTLAAVTGHPAVAIGAGATLTGESLLMRIMMQPEGPHYLARALKLQKIGKPLGEVGDALAKLAIVAPKEQEQPGSQR